MPTDIPLRDVWDEYAELNKIKVPLADLRIQIIELMKQGHKEIPLADLLWIIKHMGDKDGN